MRNKFAAILLLAVFLACTPIARAQVGGGFGGGGGGGSGGGGGGTGCNTAGTSMLKGNGTGGCANATAGTDYQAPALGIPNITSSKTITNAASPYTVLSTDSLLYASAGASADTVLLLPAATGSKRVLIEMRVNDGNPHHVILRPNGTDTIFPNNSGSGSSDLWCDIEGESVWLQDFAAGQWLLF